MTMSEQQGQSEGNSQPKQSLTVFDACTMIVGLIVGAAFRYRNHGDPQDS